ncbi:MAG: toast rack family protein [Chloroflexota bacterium]
MKTLLSFLLILTLATLACGFSVDIPSRPTPGAEVTDEITVAVPKPAQSGAEVSGQNGAEVPAETRLELSFGAGDLRLSPGAEDALVQGTATYNIADFKPTVTTQGGQVEIRQGEYRFQSTNLADIVNEWDLQLGDAPMELTVNAGAYNGIYELGGLALTGLTIKDGAADVSVSFAEPNLIEMSVLRYETGASNVELSGLSNANFSTLVFNGGAGDFTLDFSGDLQRDAIATVDSGFSDLKLVIPKEMNAKVTVEGAAVNVNHSSGWAQSGQTYSQAGEGPLLTVIISMGAGNVTITD